MKIPYSDIYNEEGALADVALETNQIWVSLIFPLPLSAVKKALGTGILEFEIDLDQIILQE